MCYTARAVALVFAMLVANTATSVEAFAPSAPLRLVNAHTASRVATTDLRMVYVPDGLTPEQWKKIKAKEAAQKKEGDLGRVGVRGFQSRSLQAWQEAGARHLFPVNPKKVKTGEIPQEKTPYMQRGGGSWDDADLAKKNLKSQSGKTIVKKKWSETDTAYANGGYLKEQSVSVFPTDPLRWTGPKFTGNVVENKRNMKIQKKVTRPGTKEPMKPAVKRRVKQEEARLQAELNSERKKGLFGLW